VTATGRRTGALLAQQGKHVRLQLKTVARQGQRTTLVSPRQGMQSQLLLNGTGKARNTELLLLLHGSGRSHEHPLKEPTLQWRAVSAEGTGTTPAAGDSNSVTYYCSRVTCVYPCRASVHQTQSASCLSGTWCTFKLHQHCKVTAAMLQSTPKRILDLQCMPINHALMALTCISEDSWSLPQVLPVRGSSQNPAHET